MAEARLLEEVIGALEDAQTAWQRIARIVKDLAAFERSYPGRTWVRLIEIVSHAMRWLPATVAQVSTVEVEDRGAPEVVASAGQIEPVAVNLVTYAATATPEGKRGVIVIRIGSNESGSARVGVIDHGVGIPPTILDRVFEPVFTTRSVGDGGGVGFGLAMNHAIVLAHGGTLTVESEVGRGSTFCMELPAATAEA